MLMTTESFLVDFTQVIQSKPFEYCVKKRAIVKATTVHNPSLSRSCTFCFCQNFNLVFLFQRFPKSQLLFCVTGYCNKRNSNAGRERVLQRLLLMHQNRKTGCQRWSTFLWKFTFLKSILKFLEDDMDGRPDVNIFRIR